jgi:undecaprenyl-diphosphatase
MRRFLKAIIVRVETASLILWMLAAGAIWGFFNIGSEVGEGDTLVLDKRILLALRNPADPSDPIGPKGFQEAMRDVTALGGVTVLSLVTIVATLALLLHGKRRRAAIFAGIVVATQVSATFLKDIYDRPRPELVPHGSYVYSSSFPSGHSTLAAATYLTLATMIASLEPKPGTKALVYVVAGLVTVSVGFSRVYLGVHWPSDVLAGWTLGAAWALLGWISLRVLQGRDS